MYETLITAFEGLDDWQPIPHARFLNLHSELDDAYLEQLVLDQREFCSRFNNQVITEAGISKQDIDDLNEMGKV